MKQKNKVSFLNKRRLRAIQQLAQKISDLEDNYREFSDDQLQAQTEVFKQRLADGETLDDLLVESYATIREVCRRILGKFPYDVQVMGAIVLHQGNIAEMKTGEGKTLTATMPLYLNALTEKGAILVTTNNYLAERDANEMRPVFEFLGLTVGLGVFDENDEPDIAMKRAVYDADITYTTGSILGFDYLTHNLSASKEDKFMRPFNYAIVDEADAVLLDNAQTPLIISGAPRVQSNLYDLCESFVSVLKEDIEFYVDRDKKEIYLTQEGNRYVNRYFAIPDLYQSAYWELNRHINLALRAHYLYKKGVDYVVHDQEVKLLDIRTGRILEGTRLQSGLHQAIETKEKVKKTRESRAIASVTYQSLFNLFPKLSGMTGTATMVEEELITTYKVSVIPIPTHLPIERVDYPDLIYRTLPEKVAAIMALTKSLHKKGQPVLMISATVEMTELYSKILLQEGIPHSTLTANSAVKEAMIIKEAGQFGTVTCATIMAGRGTDIKLGEGVLDLGGLAVIGTERMVNSRMDWQLRGRSGRQGDPGMTQFFVSLEDELLVRYGAEWVKGYLKKHSKETDKRFGKPLKSRKFKRALINAQLKSEDQAFAARQSTIQFDESLRIQRQQIYNLRDRLLEEVNLHPKIESVLKEEIVAYLKRSPQRDRQALHRYILENYSYSFRRFPSRFDSQDNRQVKSLLQNLAQEELDRKSRLFKDEEGRDTFYRLAILKAIDEAWVEEVDSLQQLKGVVSTRSYAQRNSMYEYYKESLQSYQKMSQSVKSKLVRNLMLSTIEKDVQGRDTIYFV